MAHYVIAVKDYSNNNIIIDPQNNIVTQDILQYFVKRNPISVYLYQNGIYTENNSKPTYIHNNSKRYSIKQKYNPNLHNYNLKNPEKYSYDKSEEMLRNKPNLDCEYCLERNYLCEGCKYAAEEENFGMILD